MLPILLALTVAGVGAVAASRGWERLQLRRRIADLKADAAQIGNAHQFVRLGEMHRALGEWPDAARAFETAVAKDSESLAARWGLAIARFKQHRYDEAETLLRTILVADPRYKFGDVSLLLAKTLAAVGKPVETITHLQTHIRKWRQPEAMFLLASAQRELGEADAAAATLDEMLLDFSRGAVPVWDAVPWRFRAARLRRELRRT